MTRICKECISPPPLALVLVGLSIGLLSPSAALASETDGTIDAIDRYAWSENTGWIDFGASTDQIRITDALLMGAAYSPNIGWIILDPAQGGVANDAEGSLSGYAWSENAGWVDFSPVAIGADGVFSGAAYSPNIGWIPFGMQDGRVATDWRPLSARSGTPAPVTDDEERSSGSSRSGSTSIRSRYQNLLSNGDAEAAARLTAEWPQLFSVPTTPPPSGTVAAFMRDLDLGMEGEDVRALQAFLNASGFPVSQAGPGSLGQETSYYGAATRSALARYQQTAGIVPAAGYFGPITRSAVAGNTPPPSVPPAASVSVRDLEAGMEGEDVRALQTFLVSRSTGTAARALAAHGVTAFFGPLTREALAEYQQAAGISPATGYFGPATRAVMQSLDTDP